LGENPSWLIQFSRNGTNPKRQRGWAEDLPIWRENCRTKMEGSNVWNLSSCLQSLDCIGLLLNTLGVFFVSSYHLMHVHCLGKVWANYSSP